VAAIDGILVQKNPQAMSLDRNVVRNNAFGLGGADPNGRDVAYDGSGSDNCFSLTGVMSTFPTDQSTFAGSCTGKNAFSQAAREQMVKWTGTGALTGWRTPGHPAKAGYTALEDFKP
jgi:hypothetical protein